MPAYNGEYEDAIRPFVDAMRHKLAVNRHKGRWEDMTLAGLLGLLKGEVKELEEAIEGGNTTEILLEAADVANLAMMAANVAVRMMNGQEPIDTERFLDRMRIGSGVSSEHAAGILQSLGAYESSPPGCGKPLVRVADTSINCGDGDEHRTHLCGPCLHQSTSAKPAASPQTGFDVVSNLYTDDEGNGYETWGSWSPRNDLSVFIYRRISDGTLFYEDHPATREKKLPIAPWTVGHHAGT